MTAATCGNNGGGNGDGGTGGDGDAEVIGPDAPPFTGTCSPTGGAQCANCMDDDSDTRIDGYDPQCSGPLDNDEGSFATGIPGDNKDAINQDCFFDGNSGAGNDGCNQHVCCLLGATTKAECAAALVGIVNNAQSEGNKYDVTKCFAPLGSAVVPDKCKMVCGSYTPPGCDCFGCCTICDPLNPTQCFDIAINPATSPNCTQQTIADPNLCKRCTKAADCGNVTCGGTSCILCPGQDPSTLPPGCNGTTVCPEPQVACDSMGACPAGTYCQTGCCIGIIL
jgi:hypothetical protein